MDAYNRAGSGFKFQNSANIGDADPLGLPVANPNTDFLAVSYDWNGITVLSFRGTDNGEFTNLNSDFWNGWVVGAGSLGGQLQEAISFYQSKTSGTLTGGPQADVVLTGHSRSVSEAGRER